MNCEECLMMLDEYVEDELGAKQAAQVSAHINACAECANLYEDLKRERHIYFQYFTSREATPALWNGVRAGIEEIERNRVSTRRRFREHLTTVFGVSSFNPSYAILPLALLIALGVVVAVFKYQFTENKYQPEMASHRSDAPEIIFPPDERGAPNIATVPDVKNAGSESVNKPAYKIADIRAANRIRKNTFHATPVNRTTRNLYSASATRKLTIEEAVEKAERQYLNAIAILSRDVKARRTRLSSDTASQFEESLADVERTINATRRAVKEQPDDTAAVQYMTAAYAKKIELLREIASN